MSYNFSETKQELEAVSEWLRKEYSQISTGRANPALLDSVSVEVYGVEQPIKNIASINTEDARTLRIAPWDKSQIGDIERAIIESKLPFSLATDDAGLRASIPQLTSENKTSLVKLLKEKLEAARVRVRNEREKIVKDIEKGDFGDDEKRDHKEELQKLVDSANKTLEEVFSKKETDVVAV